MISFKNSFAKSNFISLGKPNDPLPKGQSKRFLMNLKVLTGYSRFISAILFSRKSVFLEITVFAMKFEFTRSTDYIGSVKIILHAPTKLEFS
jgi:hypothetical protein